MNLEGHAAGENARYLRQGMRLIEQLDDDVYAGRPEGPFRGGVGSQLRHCVDFYSCFLAGLEDAKIDYGHRERDDRLEVDRQHALQRIEQVARALEVLDLGNGPRGVQVRSETRSTGGPEWSGSTIDRELQFLASHTIHHYALIVALLLLQRVELGPEFAEFGVAPSTLEHWRDSRTATGSVSE